MSKVIKADTMDHLGLINHSPLMPESSPTPFVDLSGALLGLLPFPTKDCEDAPGK